MCVNAGSNVCTLLYIRAERRTFAPLERGRPRPHRWRARTTALPGRAGRPRSNEKMTKTDLLLLLAAVIVLLLAIVVVVLLLQMKRRRRLLRLRDKVIAEETERYESLKNELKQRAIL